jgi:hypothetical protein
MSPDDTALYRDVFGVAATLASNALVAVFDSAAEIVIDDVITQAPAATVRAVDAPAAASGQAFVVDAVSYTVRQVLRLPPDGAWLRLVLARG